LSLYLLKELSVVKHRVKSISFKSPLSLNVLSSSNAE
jgi:hypothetical protein